MIPDTRKEPKTEDLLYKQIIKFFSAEEKKIKKKFEIKFIEMPNSKIQNLPPARFSGRQSWVSKEMIGEMAKNLGIYIRQSGGKYNRIIAYARGSYLEAVRLAGIESVLREDELAILKKKGIRWMKVGLRMDEAFNIFKQRIVEFAQDNGENKQLTLF